MYMIVTIRTLHVGLHVIVTWRVFHNQCLIYRLSKTLLQANINKIFRNSLTFTPGNFHNHLMCKVLIRSPSMFASCVVAIVAGLAI